MIGLTACTFTGEKQRNEQLHQAIKKLEENEFDLLYMKKSYEEYEKVVSELVADSYIEKLKDQIVFGYDEQSYTRSDMKLMTQPEWHEHQKRMLSIMEGLGMDKLETNIRISIPYETDNKNKLYLYTSSLFRLQGEEFTYVTKRYELQLNENRWLVTDVETDKVTLGEGSEEQREQDKAKLDFQLHGEQPVQYHEEVLVIKVS